MKKFFLACIFCLILPSMGWSTQPLRLTTLEWSPYAGRQLTNYGFSSEIIQKAFSAVGVETAVRFQSWEKAMQATEAGQFNGLYSAYYTEARAEKFIYSDSYAESIIALFKHKDTGITYSRLEDLKGYRIGVTRGFANTPEFDAADYLTKIPAETESDSLRNLLDGRVDILVMDKYRCLYLLSRLAPDRKKEIVALSNTLERKPLYLIFPRTIQDSQTYAALFNKGLRQIRENGLYDLILGRHRFMPEKAIFLGTLEWAPYAGQHLPGNGLVSMIVQKAFEKVGYAIHITFRPWARILAETEAGRHDVAFPAYYSKERNQKFTLVPLNIKSQLGLMKLDNIKRTSYSSLLDLKPYNIGIVHGYLNRPDFDQATFLKKKVVFTDQSNIKNLIDGHLDLIVIDKLVATHLMKQFPGQNYTFLTPLLDEKDLYLAFSKKVADAPLKITAFQYGLQEMMKEGELDRIIRQYLQKQYIPATP